MLPELFSNNQMLDKHVNIQAIALPSAVHVLATRGAMQRKAIREKVEITEL